MHLFRFILISSVFGALHANGQQSINVNNLRGKTFVSRTLEYLEILNDSTLYSSFNSYSDTANFFIRHDTLFIKQSYLHSDQTGIKCINKVYDYRIINLSDDTIRLENNYRFDGKPTNWEDTLFFVNVEKLKEPVTDFKFLKLSYSSPWHGTKQITIDSLGRVTFIERPVFSRINNPGADRNMKPKNIKGQLTSKEFANFKNTLSKSLPSRLPFKRGCPIDGATSNFEIQIGGKKIISTGCDLSWTHTFLLNYICSLNQNKGLLKKNEVAITMYTGVLCIILM